MKITLKIIQNTQSRKEKQFNWLVKLQHTKTQQQHSVKNDECTETETAESNIDWLRSVVRKKRCTGGAFGSILSSLIDYARAK